MEDGETTTPDDPGVEPTPEPVPDVGESTATDVWTFEPPSASVMEPPPVSAPLPPPPSTSTAPSTRGFPWVTVVVGVLALGAIVALLLMFMSASNDKNDAEDALAESQSELADAKSDLADTEAALAKSEAALATAESDLSDAEAARDAAEAAQAEAEAARDEHQRRADEYEAASAAFLAVSFGAGLGLDDGDAECLAQGLIDSLGAEALGSLASAAGSADPDAEVAAFGVEMLRIAEDCGIDPDAMDSPSASDPFAYGDDPELDALYDDCAAGDAVACDDLYVSSAPGSEYEQFAGTCGDRFEYSDTEFCEGRF